MATWLALARNLLIQLLTTSLTESLELVSCSGGLNVTLLWISSSLIVSMGRLSDWNSSSSNDNDTNNWPWRDGSGGTTHAVGELTREMMQHCSQAGKACLLEAIQHECVEEIHVVLPCRRGLEYSRINDFIQYNTRDKGCMNWAGTAAQAISHGGGGDALWIEQQLVKGLKTEV